MAYQVEYYIVDRKALPEVYIKVVEAKRMLAAGEVSSVQEAAKKLDISRSSFYKYKDDIFPFHENSRGKTINIMLLLDDEPGLLSNVLNEIAKCRANILTIHQSIPIGGIASVTLGMEMRPETKEVNEIITLDEYKEYSNKIVNDIVIIDDKLNNLNKELSILENRIIPDDDYTKIVKEYLSFKKPNKAMLAHIIDKIYIDKNKQITIKYRIKNPN